MARLGFAFKSFFTPANAIPSIIWGLVFLAVPTVISVIGGAILTLGSLDRVLLGIASLLLLLAVALGWRYQHMPIPVAVTASHAASTTHITTDPTKAVVVSRLEIRQRLEEPYESVRFPGRSPELHFVGIYNPPGNPTATHVRVEYIGMEPWPKNVRDRPPDFPSIVPVKGSGDPRIGLTLYPDTEELWQVAITYPDGQGEGNFFVQGIAVSNWPHGTGHMWSFERDERWRLRLQVSADGLPTTHFQVLMEPAGDAIRCRLEGVTS